MRPSSARAFSDRYSMAEDLLKPQRFHILLALAEQDLHGYGIQRDVLDRTGGGLMLWPAMLYRSLNALADQGLIEPVEGPDEFVT